MTYQSKNHFSDIAADKIRVILVDDSNVVLSIFERVLLSSGIIEIAGKANCADDALALMDTISADIILLDIEMPNRTGLDALPDIIAKAGDGKVIIVSAFVDSSGPSAIRALSLGACDTLAKPGKGGANGSFSNQLLEKIIRLGKNDKNIQFDDNGFKDDLPKIEKPKAICIGASTGGIPAIQEFLENLSSHVTAPIFIAQHLPDAFICYFARQLDQGKREVVTVDESVLIEESKIYLASGDGHIIIKPSLDEFYAERLDHYDHSKYTPSADALLHSAAETFGGSALALVMSGMGQDGVKGAQKLHDRNSTVWTQDQKSSVVWGMPGSIVKQGFSNAQLNPKEMAQALNKVYMS